MAANSLVISSFENKYRINASRKTFPYQVFIPLFDEPDYLQAELSAAAARLLNTDCVTLVFTNGTIKQTHAFIGETATTDMVLILDGDLSLDPGPFKMFPTEVFGDEAEFVHLWHVRNPINGLEYGHGGPKLFNREQLRTAEALIGVDMTTTFDKGMVIHTECVGTHKFNWSAGSTYRTAFREAAKLTKIIIDENDEDARTETAFRLNTWLTVASDEAEYGEFCLAGATAGAAFAQQNDSLAQINDYSWLYAQFKQEFPNDY